MKKPHIRVEVLKGDPIQGTGWVRLVRQVNRDGSMKIVSTSAPTAAELIEKPDPLLTSQAALEAG